MSLEPVTDSPDPRLQEALTEYLERIDRGEAVDREAFLSEFPDLARELAPLLETANTLEQIGENNGEPRSPDLSTHSQLSHDIETIAPGRQGKEAATSGPLPAEFGRYRIIKPLGQGAMGVVYLAEDTQLHRKVALKTSSFDNDKSGELLERFYREARSAATLRHPHICPVYDVGEIQGRHYISMAYIEGRALATFVNARGNLHERQVLVLIRKLALALQDAHGHEIVHRDLKPANIMVDLKGEPIIMDFGLARVGYSEEESRLTQVGTIVGSPAYMSPEQVGGDPEHLTGAADQYSLGVILFELLVGHPPFRGPVTAVVGQILTQPPPRLSSLRSDVSPAVEMLCLKMLAKSPGDRFASMKSVADEIASLLRGSSSEKGPAGQEDGASPQSGVLRSSLHEALVQEARQRLKQRDYSRAIEMLQQIPEADRPPEAARLLAQALKLMDEVNFVLQEMEAALQSRDGAKLARRAQELVKLKPDHPRARQVRELIKKHGPERALQFLSEDSGTSPTRPVKRGSGRRMGLIAGGILAPLLLLGVVIWFGSGKTRLKVTVNDPTIEIAFRGSQLSIKDGASQVGVEPGEQELTIRVAGTEFQTPRFSLKKGTTTVVEVERAKDNLAVNLSGRELAAWPIEPAPRPPAKVSPPQIAAAPVGSPLRYFGYNILADGANVARVANHTNFITDACWRTAGGDAVLIAAKQAKVPVFIGIQNASPDTLERLDATIKKYPEVVAGVIWEWAYFQGHTPDEVAALARAFKRQYPGRQVWMTMVEEPLGQIETRPVPPEIDGFQVFFHYVTNPDQFRQKADRFLPGFVLKANGRPVVLGWNVFDNNAPGLAARTQPGTMAAAVEIAKSYKLAGVQYAHLGNEPGYHVLGMQTNPALLEEVEAVARTLGINPSSNGEAQKGSLDENRKVKHSTAGNAASAASAADAGEWTDLFNGRDLTGWEVVNAKGVFRLAADSGWPVANSVLWCATGDEGWLRSTGDYDDFELELEFQTTAKGNGGILIRTRDTAAPPTDGLEIELNAHGAGGIASVATPSKSHLRPEGEWNHLKIRAKALKCVVELNGQPTADEDLASHPRAFKLHSSGRIGIYNYKGLAKDMSFRNIRIQKLSPTGKTVKRGDPNPL